MDTTPSPGKHARARRHFSNPGKLAIVTAISAFLGMTFLLYPTAANWFSQYNQSKVIASYESRVNQAQPDPQTQIERAHAYNDALRVGALLEANTNIPTSHEITTDETLVYEKLLAVGNTGLMARLRIPQIDIDLPIYHGTSDDVLATSIGHLKGTSLPVGGVGTRAVITGHRGLATARLFTDLDRLTINDTFTIEVFGEVLAYRVIETKVVKPDETESIRAVKDRDLFTLVTCTPLGINTHRILVTGERVFPTPQAEIDAKGQKPLIPRFPWWLVWFTLGTLTIAGYLWWSGHTAARNEQVEDKNINKSGQ